METIECFLCGRQLRSLTVHILKKHGITAAVYLTQFPGALLDLPGNRKRSDESRKKQSEAASRRWSNPAERKAQSERMEGGGPWAGQRLSEEHRAAISRGGRGKTHKLSSEDRDRVGLQGKRVLRDIVRIDPAWRSKLSEAVRRRLGRGERIGFQRVEAQQKSHDTRAKNGTLTPYGAGRGICGFRKDLTHYTRSTLEANFARVLLAAGVVYKYEPQCFEIADKVFYTPDFFLEVPLSHDGEALVPAGWVELKGWRFKDGSLPDGTEEKAVALAKLVEEPVSIITQADPLWRKIEALWRTSLQMWETSRRNLRTDPGVFGIGRG